MRDVFRRFAESISRAAGHPSAFVLALVIIIVWGVSGPIFHYSDTWQLVINTGTTIVTFLMVFLLQNTQNRESRATQLKLDELLRALKSARNSMVDIEELSDEELDRLAEEFHAMHQKADTTRQARRARRRGRD